MQSGRTLGAVLVIAVLGIASVVTAFLYFGNGDGSVITIPCGARTCTSQGGLSTATTTITTTFITTRPTIQTTATATVTTTTTTTYTCCNQLTHRLGFWLQESDVMDRYSASTFFNAMFLTSPFPSSLDVMIFGVVQDQTNNYGCSTSAHYTGQSASYWGNISQKADSYPNIRLVYEIAFDPSNGGSGIYGLGCFNALVQSLAQHPSVYGIGIEGEYTKPASALTSAEMQNAMNDVVSAGKHFVNYYVSAGNIPPGGYDITHTNFPAQGDQVGTLQAADSKTVGISSGYYDSFPFPSTFTCPIGPGAVAVGALTNEPQGYNQCVVSTELSVAVSLPPAERQFLELAPGFSSNSTFTGVTGQSTNQLWDNPTLRNWIWTDPNYLSIFVLSP